MKVIFDHSEAVAKNIRIFWFKPEREVKNTPGQFVELMIKHENKDSRGEKRWFTLSSSPSEPLVAITTKLVPECSSFKKALQALKPGDEVNMSSPMGDFVLPKDPDQPVLLVAGGIGCTPYRSMITYLLSKGEKRTISVLYAANSLEEVAFEEVFNSSIVNDFTSMLGNPPANWHGLSGRLDAATVLDRLSDKENSLVYLSGPEPMIESLAKSLKSEGFNKKNIMTDFFPGYTDI